MNEKKDRLARGSIRVFKDAIFNEERDVQQVTITYKELKATLHTTSVPNDLKEIFDEAHIGWEPGTKSGCRLRGYIKGLDFDKIETADEGFLRIQFSGLTQSALRIKLKNAKEWLDERNIKRGETDGKEFCIFQCISSRQLETEEF